MSLFDDIFGIKNDPYVGKQPGSYKVDVYKVYDSDGNVVKELRYPVNPETGKSYLTPDDGETAYVYQPNDPKKEVWVSTKEATATTSIDPVSGKITVKGPSWLTEEIINSDSFKQNYSQNKGLLAAVNLYRQDPNAKFADGADGSPISAAEAIGQYSQMADIYSKQYTKLANAKQAAKDKFGIDYTDEDVYIESSFATRDDYNKSDLVYIPDDVIEKFGSYITGLESYNPENKTISMEDFFENAYFNTMSEGQGAKLREHAMKELEKALEIGRLTKDESEEYVRSEVSKAEYANQIARDVQFYRLLAGNDDKMSAGLNAIYGAYSAANSFASQIVKGGLSIAAWFDDTKDGVVNLVKAITPDGSAVENIASTYTEAVWTFNPFYLSAWVLGEVCSFPEFFNPLNWDSRAEAFSSMLNDATAFFSKTDLGGVWDKRREEIMGMYDEFNARNRGLKPTAWDIGQFAGVIAYKIFENIIILEPLGGAVEAGTKTVLGKILGMSAKSVGRGVSLVGGPKLAASLIDVAGWGVNNVIVQGLLETMIDDREVLKSALASGQMTDEAWDAVKNNMMWNAVGGAAGWFTGKGVKAALPWLIENTSSAKLAAMVGLKITHKAASYYDSGLHKFFTWLNGGEWNGVVAEGEDAAHALGRFNSSMYGKLAEQSKTIAELPVLGKLDNSQLAKRLGKLDGDTQRLLDKAWDMVDPERNLAKNLASDPETSALVKAVEEGKGSKSALFKKLDDRITENWLNMNKQVLIKANLQNQIDMISKGVSIRMTEINNYAGKTLKDYNDTLNTVTKAESKVGGLHYPTKNSGFVLSQESSDYLSYSSQSYRYANKVARGEKVGWKKAGFKSQQEFTSWKEYSKAVQGKLAELEGKLGKKVTEALDEHLIAKAKYIEKIDNFMIRRGYYDIDYAKKIKAWRDSGDWKGADDQSRFIHTARMFETEEGLYKTLSEFDNPAMFARKPMTDESKYLKPGNIDDHFMDPTLVDVLYLRSAASAAQAQELGRAVYAVGVPTRAVQGFTEDGVTKAEASVLAADVKGLKAEFYQALDKEGIAKSLKDAIDANTPYAVGYKRARVAKGTGPSDKTRAAKAKMKAAEKDIDTVLARTQKQSTELINGTTEANLDNILTELPDDITVPEFSVRKVTAANYQEWKDALPYKSKKMIDDGLKKSGYSDNVTNMKKLAKDDPNFTQKLKANYIDDPKGPVRATEAYKNNVKKLAEADMSATERSALGDLRNKYVKAREKYEKALEKDEAAKVIPGNPASYGKEFVESVGKTTSDLITDTIHKMRGNDAFNSVVESMVEKGATKELAERYIVLYHLDNLKESAFTGSTDLAISNAAKVGGRNVNTIKELKNTVGKGIKSNISTEFAKVQGDMSKEALEAMDVGSYFKSLQNNVNEIESLGITLDKESTTYKLNEVGKTKLLQLVDKEGTLRFYEVDPTYASLVNFQPSYYFNETNRLMEFWYGFNGFVNNIFRWGTTGIDRVSYLNQWAKDSLDATIWGAGQPFSNLTVSNAGVAALHDSVPLGVRAFGETATESFTKEYVDSLFDSSESALKGAFGEGYVDEIRATATKGLSGDAAESAYRRAIVEDYIGESGYEALPGIGSMTQAEFYRSSATKGERPIGEKVTQGELRQEYYRGVYTENTEGLKRFSQQTKKMRERVSDFFRDSSRGQWRESFWRKNVYASSYKNAITAGNTPAEAKIFATRFALDSTTDFARTYAYANRFIRSVPYLGASINGMKSFMRLLELDPLGMAVRFTSGVAIPYMALLSQALSDPSVRKAYKDLPEYVKSSSLVISCNGSFITIPLPEQIAAVLNPFRHFVEKAAGAQDASWLNIIASDALQAMPIDMSGFIDLDPQTIMSEAGGEVTLGSRISRGVEKASSSLMGPLTKSAYMYVSGRDPFTGYEINKSYVTIDDEGNEVVMDNTQSKIAQELGKHFPKLQASGVYAVLKTLLGRSTLSILDGATDVVFDGIKSEDILDKILEGPASALEKAYTYQAANKAKNEWSGFVSEAYNRRKALLNDDGFRKAYTTLQTADKSSEKYKGALRTYKEKLDDYTKFVLDGTRAYKNAYPDSYTTGRAAQVISVLTLDTGVTYNERASSAELRTDQYYDAKNAAIDTYVKMGFPSDYAGDTILGRGYYDANDGNKFKFKVFTPYEIQALQNSIFSTADEIQALIKQELKANGIDKSKMWAGYYDADTKAERKQYQEEWNAQVVKALTPLIEKYGVQTMVYNNSLVDELDDYIFVGKQYNAKSYLKKIFEGAL